MKNIITLIILTILLTGCTLPINTVVEYQSGEQTLTYRSEKDIEFSVKVMPDGTKEITFSANASDPAAIQAEANKTSAEVIKTLIEMK